MSWSTSIMSYGSSVTFAILMNLTNSSPSPYSASLWGRAHCHLHFECIPSLAKRVLLILCIFRQNKHLLQIRIDSLAGQHNSLCKIQTSHAPFSLFDIIQDKTSDSDGSPFCITFVPDIRKGFITTNVKYSKIKCLVYNKILWYPCKESPKLFANRNRPLIESFVILCLPLVVFF